VAAGESLIVAACAAFQAKIVKSRNRRKQAARQWQTNSLTCVFSIPMSIAIKSERSIPTFNPTQLIAEFAVRDGYWQQPVFKDMETFGFHRLETTRHLLKPPLPPHRKTFHDFFFVTGGLLQRSKGFENHTVAPHTFVFVPAHQITSNDFVSADVAGFMCHFTDQIINPTHHPFLKDMDFLRFNGNPIVQVPQAHLPVTQILLERIEAEFLRNLPDKYLLIQSYLITLFLELSRFTTPVASFPTNTPAQITEQFKNLLTLHIREKQRITDYAEMLCITPNHLNKCVKKTTNRTASDWLNEMILLETKVLLSQTRLSIAEIARQVGVEDQSYFGRFFKKKTGISPSEYRKMIEKSEILPFLS
jgi:AraC-like DNA-binding protein